MLRLAWRTPGKWFRNFLGKRYAGLSCGVNFKPARSELSVNFLIRFVFVPLAQRGRSVV